MSDCRPRWSFRKRMWVLFGAAVALCLVLMAPMYVHVWIMQSRVATLKREFKESLRHRQDIDEGERWLRQHGFTVIPGKAPRGRESILIAHQHLSDGSPFWLPVSAQAIVTFDSDGEIRSNRWTVWPFATPPGGSSRWDRIVPQYSPFIVLAAIITIIALTNRRDMRRKRSLCVECAYPIGTSDVCTECGAPTESPKKS